MRHTSRKSCDDGDLAFSPPIRIPFSRGMMATAIAIGLTLTSFEITVDAGVKFFELDFTTGRPSVSRDGNWVTGTVYAPEKEEPCPPNAGCILPTSAFRWQNEIGLQPIHALDRGSAIASDGTRIVGRETLLGNPMGPNVWDESVGVLDFGSVDTIPDLGYATDISADGQVAVGGFGDEWFSVSTGGEFQAFRWTADGGIETLGDLPGGTVRSFSTAVSSDGSVVVGHGTAFSNAGGEAFRWTEETGMVGLGLLNGRIMSTATDVSGDGKVVVGYAYGLRERHVAFRWTEETGMVALNFEHPYAVNRDGSTIVGDSDGRAVVWDERHGTRTLERVLVSDFGLPSNVLVDWNLTAATGISDDGKTIVGTGENQSFTLSNNWVFADFGPGHGLGFDDIDFDQDGQILVNDVDLLMNAIGNGNLGSLFDLDSDGAVNDRDRDEWLAVAGQAKGFSGAILLGDANLDGVVNILDLNALGTSWRSENHDWSLGNFTDGRTNAADLNLIGINWQRSVPLAAAVPEPTRLNWVWWALVFLPFMKQRLRCR